MPKRKPTAPKSEPEIADLENSNVFAGSEAQTSVVSESEKPEKRRTGVFIPLTEDGSVDAKRLKGDDWKLDAVRKALAMSYGTTEAKVSGLEVSEDFVRGLYSGFEMVLQRVGTMFLKWPADLAGFMRYSDEQKKKLVPTTKAVIEKLAPTWLIKHQEIATFAVILASETHQMVYGALAQYIALHPELTQPPKPANGSAIKSENRDIQ